MKRTQKYALILVLGQLDDIIVIKKKEAEKVPQTSIIDQITEPEPPAQDSEASS